MDQIHDLISRGITNIIPDRATLEKLLASGEKLNIYLGIDPTGTRIHLGHAVSLRKLQQFVALGHDVTFLVGDFTAKVGDTSDKESQRPILTDDQIKTNFQTYQDQAAKILDFSKVKIVYNSEWLSKLTFADLIGLSQRFTLNDFISRELIKNRLSAGGSVRLDETLYPLMQGYDSYHLDTDIQIGAADQTFNMQAGRTLQRQLRHKESFILVTAYLSGTDGRKMSKTWDNAIWLTDTPEDIYGKVMSLKDELVEEYFTLATSTPLDQIKSILQQSPLEAKHKLAHTIVTELHDPAVADQAASGFTSHYQERQPKPVKLEAPQTLSALELVQKYGAYDSNSDRKRVIDQGGLEVSGVKITDPQTPINLNAGLVIKIGPHILIQLTA